MNGIMKKAKIIIGLICLTILIVFVAVFCFGELFGGVKIDEKTFPDENFRTYLLEKQDHNKDKRLPPDQIGVINYFTLEDCDNLQGIEEFTSLRTLTLVNCKDMSALESVTSLRTLHLIDCKNVSIDFSKFTDLTSLTITNSEVNVDIDMSGFQYIKNIEIEDSTVRSLTLNGCPILDKVYIHTSSADTLKIGNCPLLNNVTIREVQKLTSIVIDDCPKLFGAYISDSPELNEVALRKCTSLYNVNVLDCSGVKEIDVRGCEYIWKVFNTPDALHITDSSKRPGYVIYGASNDMALKALKLPDIRIECLSDVEIITK